MDILDELAKYHLKLISHDSNELPEDIDKTISTVKSAMQHIKDQETKIQGLVEGLEPFDHPDLRKIFSGNAQGDDSPVFGRNKAILTIGDFKRLHQVLTAYKERK